MGMIPEFTLPSNPAVTVRMREALVSDALDFCDVAEGCEEVVTSLFLDRLQDKASWDDPRKWTGQDRRFVLYWYWLHTEKDLDIPLSFDCPVCGKRHTALVDGRSLAEKYRTITGKPERDIECDGDTVTVHPLLGADLEELEGLRLAIQAEAETHGENSRQAGLARARMAVSEFVLSIRFASESAQNNARKYREHKIETMTMAEFYDLAEKVRAAQVEMEHGIESVVKDGQVYFLTPSVRCPEEDKEGPRLRLPFRYLDYIPRI